MSGMSDIELRHFYALQAKVQRLEAMMQLLLTRLDIDPAEVEPQGGPLEDQNIHEALLRGNKIEAIKIYREQTGIGLKEAKDYIDALERQMRGY